jgi:choline dehydrogenase
MIGHGYTGWLGTALTDLQLVIENSKLLSLIISAGTAMGQGLAGRVFSTVDSLTEVLLRDINAPGQVEKPGLYQVPLSMTDSVRNCPRNFVLDTANAKNSDGSRKCHLDIRLNTLVTNCALSSMEPRPRL